MMVKEEEGWMIKAQIITVINWMPCACVDMFQDFVLPQKAISSSFGMHMDCFALANPCL